MNICLCLPFLSLIIFRAKYAVVAVEARQARGDDDLESVQELERLLDVAKRWTTTSVKWVATTVEIKKRRYQLALNALELLIVERIFELTKMNQSQTGAW